MSGTWSRWQAPSDGFDGMIKKGEVETAHDPEQLGWKAVQTS